MQKPSWLSEDDFDSLCFSCLSKANKIKTSGLYESIDEVDVFQLTDLLVKLELEKLEKNIESDRLLDYNDEIISIEDVGQKETIDISVTGDNLFYCSDILTKNSYGLPMTVDFMYAMIRTEELDNLNQVMIKQIANRYEDVNFYKRFVVGVDRARMKFYDVENVAQKNISDSGVDTPQFDKGSFGSRMKSAGNSDFKF